ncbi:MAG: SpoIIE family protein phosphatase [Acidobacteria bacterium]|nr:SpoIIE family protein phosphatase [Acidobacteriota bacterium]
MDFLTVVTPAGQTFRHEIAASVLRIGRASTNDLNLPDLNVSRVHAQIERHPDGFYVADAGGKNGTFVNERRVAGPTLLRPGDRVRVGTTTLIFNGSAGSSVEFSDRPLLAGAGTTCLPAGTIRTPALTDIPLLLEVTPPPPTGGPDVMPGARGAGAAEDRGARGAASPSAEARGRSLASSPSLGAILAEANEQLVFHRPLRELLDTIMDLARRAVPFERGLLMLREEGDRLEPQVVRVPPDEAGKTISISRTITDRVVLNKESVLTSDALLDDRFRRGQSVEAQRLRSVLCVPLWNNRDVIGLIYVDNRHRAGVFTEENLRVLAHLANVAAVKIENARLFEQVVAAERMEQELQNAAEIQEHLLPAQGPPIPNYLVYGHSEPCRAVGGDYYDFLALPGGRYGIGLGDVAGKGLPAALLMCSFQASLHALSELNLPLAEMIARLNRLLSRQIPENRFVTFFYGVLDPARHTMAYVNAGHNAPSLLRPGATPEGLAVTGLPLGMIAPATFGVREVAFGPGDILVCYSDGVTEEASAGGEQFGEARLLMATREAQESAPGDIARRINEALNEHCSGAPRQDDTTLVILKRTA